MYGLVQTDIQAGNLAGCKTVLVQTGYGAEESKTQQDRIKPDRIAPDLVDSIRLDPDTISY
jgi:ribonucleotide monophosphatase NagD (HAD superfamily)